jgi:hypothetical protein
MLVGQLGIIDEGSSGRRKSTLSAEHERSRSSQRPDTC